VGTGGMMQTLLRTWVGTPDGAFTLSTAHTLEDLRQRAEEQTLATALVSLEKVVADWIVARLTEGQIARFRMGQAVLRSELSFEDTTPEQASPVAVLDRFGTMCGIAKLDAESLHPVKVFPAEPNE